MKVCLVSYEYPPNIIGGAGTYAELLVKGLKKLNVSVHILTHGSTKKIEDNVTRIDSPDVAYWRRMFFSYYAPKIINQLDRRYDFDIIHFNEPHILLKDIKIPTISSLHSTQMNELKVRLSNFRVISPREMCETFIKSPVGSVGDIAATSRSRRIICPCSDLKKMIERYCFVKNDVIDVIPNGIDTSEYEKYSGKSNFLEKYSLDKEGYLLFMGRLDKIKGIEYIIHAFRGLKKRYHGLKLALAGRGPYENYLKHLSSPLNDVVFLGHVSSLEDKQALYSNCIAVVLPSLYEAFPMVLLEAMASRKPVVASSVGGIPDIVEDKVNGFLVKPLKTEDFETAIQTLMDNPDLRYEMGYRNYRLVKKKYTLSIMAKRTVESYERLMRGTG